ncbi:MAG: TIGR01777 family oxidoreductase [Phycisphaerales bacterium]|nr:TIGR01777 family oxidoreductase [Phycisphaerales bacterium]
MTTNEQHDHPRKYILAGGSGFLGMNLARSLTSQGAQVVILSRSAPGQSQSDASLRSVQWDGETLGPWVQELNGADALVNFSGKSIECVPTDENKQLIISSRVNPTRVLGQAIEQAEQPPSTWVQLSAVGIYGNTQSRCTESTPPGDGFLPESCTQWESAFHESCPASVRGVVLRAGVVLGKTEGAFPKLRKIAKLGFGGRAGSGKQGISWIHEEDINAMLLHAINTPSVQGTYNATAPTPASNKEFMAALRKAVGMPFGPPAPAFAVRLGSRYVLRTNPDLALEGQYAIPERMVSEGFEFQHPLLDDALSDLCTKSS